MQSEVTNGEGLVTHILLPTGHRCRPKLSSCWLHSRPLPRPSHNSWKIFQAEKNIKDEINKCNSNKEPMSNVYHIIKGHYLKKLYCFLQGPFSCKTKLNWCYSGPYQVRSAEKSSPLNIKAVEDQVKSSPGLEVINGQAK